jgi:hypothetical protein
MALNKMLKKIITIFCLTLAIPSFAGTSADLQLEIEFNETNGVVLEAQGEFIARVTNFGPDIAAANTTALPIGILSSVIQDNGSFTPEIVLDPAPENNNNECFFILIIGDPPPGGGVVYAYDLNVPSLEVNETAECYGTFTRNFQSGTREINWLIDNPYDVDPNTNNNTQSVIFGVPPTPVSSLSEFSLFLLLLMVLILGIQSQKHSSK